MDDGDKQDAKDGSDAGNKQIPLPSLPPPPPQTSPHPKAHAVVKQHTVS